MSNTKKVAIFHGILLVILAITLVLSHHYDVMRAKQSQPAVVSLPAAPDPKFLAAIEVARVFGRAPGCANASTELITAVADESVRMKLDARTFAALIAIESGCNQYATSSKGAIGLTMVVPRTWKNSFDFETRYNLLNRNDNLHVGASILSDFISRYGPVLGLRHYNGMNIANADYDADYTGKIMTLAGRK
jgi:soluble lytic murein transglycosylase-like protein